MFDAIYVYSIDVNSCWQGILCLASCWCKIKVCFFNFLDCSSASSSGGIMDLKQIHWEATWLRDMKPKSLINLAVDLFYISIISMTSCHVLLVFLSLPKLSKQTWLIPPGSWCGLGIGPQFGRIRCTNKNKGRAASLLPFLSAVILVQLFSLFLYHLNPPPTIPTKKW